METIKFRIIKYNDMCRIEANDIRGTYKTIAPRGCICSLDIMLEEMERITKEQIIENVNAQRYVEGADYFLMEQLKTNFKI